MTKTDRLITDGVVIKTERDGYRVRLDRTGHEIIAYLSGKVRLSKVRVILGDRVAVELSAADISRGRIVWRYK